MPKRITDSGDRICRYSHAGVAPALAAAAILALAPAAAQAHTATPRPFKEAAITLQNHHGAQTTVVVGHDGEKYTHIENGEITARFRLQAKVKAGHRILGFVVTTGDPSNEDMLPNHMKGAEKQLKQRKLDSFATFRMDTETALSTGIWGNSPTTPQDIVNRCNDEFSELPESKQGLEQIELTIHAGFSAGKRRRDNQAGDGWFTGSEGRPGIAHTTLPVTIVCQSFRRAVLPPPTPPRAGNTLHSIDLNVQQHGERCPKDITVKTYANYQWPAESRMRMTVNGGRPKVRLAKTKKVTFAGKTFHRAEARFTYKLDPGQKTFTLTVDRKKGKTHTETVEIKCPPFKVTSTWLKYDVEDRPSCPRIVTETTTHNTTRPGWVDHEIRMKGGLVVSKGKLTSKRVGDKYVATAVRNLTLNAIDTEFMADAVDYPANSGWVALQLECPKRNVETGSNAFQVAPTPTDDQARQKRLKDLKATRVKAEAEKRRRAKIQAKKAKQARKLAEKRRRDAAKKKAEAEKRRKALVAAKKAKQVREAARKRREPLNRLADKPRNSSETRNRIVRRNFNATKSSRAAARAMRGRR